MTAAITPSIGSPYPAPESRQNLRLVDSSANESRLASLPSLRAVAGLPQLAPVVVEPVEPVLATVHRLPVPTNPVMYQRRRLMVVAVVTALLIGLASMLSQPSAGDAGSSVANSTVASGESVTVVVAPGDTLWAIANDVNPNGNTRALVDQLVDLAGSASLQPGQTLTIPSSWLN